MIPRTARTIVDKAKRRVNKGAAPDEIPAAPSGAGFFVGEALRPGLRLLAHVVRRRSAEAQPAAHRIFDAQNLEDRGA